MIHMLYVVYKRGSLEDRLPLRCITPSWLNYNTQKHTKHQWEDPLNAILYFFLKAHTSSAPRWFVHLCLPENHKRFNSICARSRHTDESQISHLNRFTVLSDHSMRLIPEHIREHQEMIRVFSALIGYPQTIWPMTKRTFVTGTSRDRPPETCVTHGCYLGNRAAAEPWGRCFEVRSGPLRWRLLIGWQSRYWRRWVSLSSSWTSVVSGLCWRPERENSPDRHLNSPS